MENKENKIINDYLNPILGELMQQSLNSILEMKKQNILNKDNKDEILFISKFIDDSEEYYTSIKDARNLAILSDLKQYILDLTT